MGQDTGNYRPWLDGVRAIAIGCVLVSHFGGRHIPQGSGEVGVGLFFALSGYLITGLLLDEHERGGIDVLAFYARRAGRLVPGLAVMIAITAPLLAIFVNSGDATRSAIGALTYTSNYGDITGLIHVNQYLQTWSLAIEEHFYLLWAPILIWSARRRGARAVLHVAVIGAAMCAAARLGVAVLDGSSMWVARGSVVRGDALLVGCTAAAAVRCRIRIPQWMLYASIPVLLTLLAAVPTVDDRQTLLLAVGLTVLSLAAAGAVVSLDQHDTWIRQALSRRPMLWLGTRSYSLYLWQYPLFVLLSGRIPLPAIFCITVIVSGASYRLVESPARSAVRVWLANRRRPAALVA